MLRTLAAKHFILEVMSKSDHVQVGQCPRGGGNPDNVPLGQCPTRTMSHQDNVLRRQIENFCVRVCVCVCNPENEQQQDTWTQIQGHTNISCG